MQKKKEREAERKEERKSFVGSNFRRRFLFFGGRFTKSLSNRAFLLEGEMFGVIARRGRIFLDERSDRGFVKVIRIFFFTRRSHQFLIFHVFLRLWVGSF